MTILSGDKVPEASEPSIEQMTAEELEQIRLNALREMLSLQQKKENLYRERRLWFFQPSPKQMEFFVHSHTKRRAGFCGNRFGKSTLGVVEDCCWLIGYRPFFEEGHPLRTAGIPSHGVKGLVIAEDWDKVKDIFTNDDSAERQGKFLDFLPKDWIKTHRNEKGIIDQIVVKSTVNGQVRESVVFFDTVKSFKQAPASFESSDWDFIHIDEPVMKDLWTAVSRGLIDRGGYAWWLLTPLKEVWMYNEIVESARTQPNLFWWFEATMDDNPTLSEEDKELYLSQLPDDERLARKKGIPLAHGRLVYHDYEEPIHLLRGSHPGWPMVSRPPYHDYMVVYAVDTHPQTPHAVLFAAVHKSGDIDFYDEIYEKGKINQLAGMIKSRLEGTRVHYGLCEPAAWNEDQGSGLSYADIFYDEGLDLIPGSKRKEDAVMLTQQLLKQRVRQVRIHERCKRLRWELVNHYFDKENKPEDKNDHMVECLRRLVIHDGLKYYEPYHTDKPQSFTNERELVVKQTHLDLGNFNLNLR